MKWYFASRVKHKQALVSLSEFLKSKGEIVLSEWVYKDSLKPYEENINAVQELSKEVVQSILQTDIFVLISDKEGTDMFVELGVALASQITSSCKIYIIGQYSKRSLMQLHPNVRHVHSIKDLLIEEQIDSEGLDVEISI